MQIFNFFLNDQISKGPQVGPAGLGDGPKGPVGLGNGREVCWVRLS